MNSFTVLKILCGGSLFEKSCPTLATPWPVACQVTLSVGFSRQEYGSGLLFPSPGNLLPQESNLALLHCKNPLCSTYSSLPTS